LFKFGILEEVARVFTQAYLNRGKKALLMLGVKFVATETESDLPPLEQQQSYIIFHLNKAQYIDTVKETLELQHELT
jgi:hypothetical protein